MMQPVRLGIIGLGYWGPNLLRNFCGTEGATVRACCDLNEQRLRKHSLHYPGVQFTQRTGDLLNNPEIDAIAIATPVHTHFKLAKEALENGKHVLVEKPLCSTVAEAEELLEIAKKKGLVIQVDHVYVYSPAVIRMKEIFDSGRLGRLLFIDSVRINLGLVQPDVNVIWDLAPHDLSIVDFLLARSPRSLAAFGSIHGKNPIEDVAYLNLDFGDSLIANFHVNWLSPVKVRHMILGGSEQSLIFNDLDTSDKIKVYNRGVDFGNGNDEQRERVLISYRSGDMWSPNLGSREPLSAMAHDFVESIRGGRHPVANGETGLRVVRILEAAQKSIKNHGARIPL